jgi:hypothetical protein
VSHGLAWLLVAGLALAGCATSVRRLPGELPASGGAARTPCESDRWLTLAPTRHQRGAQPADDGIGIYRVGSDHPESIPSLGEELGASREIERHAGAVRAHDRDRFIAAALGGAGLVAVGVGAALFAGSFESRQVRQSDGTLEEEHEIRSSTLIGGGILVGAGFGLAIAGIVVNPNARERAEADSWRYVLVPGRDDVKAVEALVVRRNQRTRAECSQGAP